MATPQAQPSSLPAPVSLINFDIRVPGWFVLGSMLAGAVVLRLALASIPGFGIDIGTFRAWSQDLSHNGPWNFYQEDKFTDYAPGYMYVLLLIGKMQQFFNLDDGQVEYILKFPSIVADVASGFLLYRMLDKQRPAVQLITTAVYLFFPAALLVGAIWGQVDSILSFFLLLTVYFIGRGKPVAGAVAYTVGFLIKPQAIAALPFLAYWIIREYPVKLRPGQAPAVPRQLVECTVYPLMLIVLLVVPFFEYEPWRLIPQLYESTNISNYRVNSFWAYNFWNTGGVFKMGFKCDLAGACDTPATQFLGMSTRWWSVIMLVSALAAIVAVLRNARGTGFLALGTGLSMLAFYLFLTRMHERYVFPAFLPLLLACALIQSRALWAGFIAMAAVHTLNLYQVFGYYFFFSEREAHRYPDFLRIPRVFNWLSGRAFGANPPSIIADLPFGIGSMETTQLLSIAFVTSFVLVLAWAYVLAYRRGPAAEAA
jgi:Gpi18-like mannosyltransferase